MAFTQIIVCPFLGTNATVTRPLMCANKRCYIQSVKLISATATTASDGSNAWTSKVTNITTTTDLSSAAVTTNGNEITANTPYSVTVDQNNDIKVNDVIGIVFTKVGTPTDLSAAIMFAEIEVMYPDGYKV
jgi:hypothetical protein